MTHSIGSLLLLGASGDLSGRLLLPAFGQLLDQQESRRGVVLVGAGAEDWDADAWRARVLTSFGTAQVSDETLQSVLGWARFPRVNADMPSKPPLGGFNLGISKHSKPLRNKRPEFFGRRTSATWRIARSNASLI